MTNKMREYSLKQNIERATELGMVVQGLVKTIEAETSTLTPLDIKESFNKYQAKLSCFKKYEHCHPNEELRECLDYTSSLINILEKNNFK